jgi:hypothetical protein
MSKKSKTSEINDIIDSSYTEADYSNDSYDDIYHSRRYRNTYNHDGNIGNINPFSKITTIRQPAPAPAYAYVSAATSVNHTNSSNVFMKYTGGSNQNSENVDKSAGTPNSIQIKNIEEEFPSLGGSKKPVAQAPVSVPVAMNFKKIVETKKPIEIVQPQIAQSKPKLNTNRNQYRAYEEVKYYSEKTARSKIRRGKYSDDEDEIEDDDDDNNYYYDDDYE